jgi:hypothetical protein
MRTTVTLDDDVARALERIQAEERSTFRRVLNEAIREGLAARERRARQGSRQTRTTHPRNLGPRLTSFDNTSELIAAIEGDTYK